MHIFKYFILLGLTFFTLNNSYSSELYILGKDWEPYSSNLLENRGVITEVINEVLKKSDLHFEIKIQPAKRVNSFLNHNLLNHNQSTVLAAYPYFGKSNDYLVSKPFAGSALVFYQKKGSNIKYKSLTDLKGLKIGLSAGLHYSAELEQATYLKKSFVKRALQNLKKLERNRVDLVLVDKYAADCLLKGKLKYIANKLEQIDPPYLVLPMYMAFNKKVPGVEKIVDKFNESIDQIKKDGSMMKIFDKYNFYQISSKTISNKELKQFVINALKFTKKAGLENAYREFRKAEGKFTIGELYIFVIDMNGFCIAHPYPNINQTNIYNVKDKYDVYIVREFIEIIKKQGEGWVEYWWPNPITKKNQPKKSFVKRYNKDLFLGAGVFR